MPTWLPIVILLLIACSGIGRRAVPVRRRQRGGGNARSGGNGRGK